MKGRHLISDDHEGADASNEPPNTTKDIMWMYVSADGVLVALVVKSIFSRSVSGKFIPEIFRNASGRDSRFVQICSRRGWFGR